MAKFSGVQKFRNFTVEISVVFEFLLQKNIVTEILTEHAENSHDSSYKF